MIKEKYIPLAECVDRGVYRIASSNLGVGVYSQERRGFIGVREKFGDKYLSTEYHYDTGAPFGTVMPLEKIGMLPPEISNEELTFNDAGGTSFAIDPATNVERGAWIRDLAPGEAPHGTRIGFVVEWADTKERVPDNVWTYVKENKKLFDFLLSIEAIDD